MPAKLVALYAAPFIGNEGVRHLQVLANAVTDSEASEADVSTITARTFVLRGDLDAWCTRVDAARLATAIPGAELRSVPMAGRLIPEDAPEALAALLASWAPPIRATDATRGLGETGD